MVPHPTQDNLVHNATLGKHFGPCNHGLICINITAQTTVTENTSAQFQMSKFQRNLKNQANTIQLSAVEKAWLNLKRSCTQQNTFFPLCG